MRICSPQLGLNPNSILGGEVFDREILLGLAKKGIKIEVILPKGKPYDHNIKNWHITTLPVKHFPAILANLIFIPYFFRVYAKRQFQIVRLHSPRYLGLGALIYKLFKSYKLSPSKITVVHNGVPNYLSPAAKDKKLIQKLKLEGKTVLLLMGLFIERKNPLFLLDLLAELSKTKPKLVSIFWGAGPLRSEIIKKAKELKVFDKIRIINPVFGPQKNKIHNLCNIFVHPALDEGFALAPLEAMACAKPVVMTKGYSASEAVQNGINGYLCSSNNENDWTHKLEKLILNSNLRKRLGEASLKKVKAEFQWNIAVGKHIKVIRNLIE